MDLLKQLTVLMNQGGSLGWAVAGVGGFGILCALFVLFGSLLKAPSKVVRFFAVSCLLLSVVTAGLGLACTYLGRQKVEKAMTGKRPALAERIQRQGYLEARSGVTLAVPLAAPPILLALLGLAVASRRRWGEYHETPPSGLGFPLVLLLLGGAGVAGAVKFYKQPLPGRELDDDSWKVRDLTDALDANEWDKCMTTEWSVPAGSAASQLGSHFDNQQRCIEHFEKLEDLEKLDAVKWVDEPKLKTALAEKIALQKAPKPPEPAAAAVAPPAAAEDISEVQAKARACFDKEKKKKPKLTVATSLSVDVSKAGKVVAVKDTGAGKPDAVRKCAATQAKALKLKAGEARKFDVPLSFP